MTKARDLANFVSAGNPLADNVISASEVSGLASVATAGTIVSLTDVYDLMSPTDGQVLTFDTTNGWQAESIPTINTLNDIANVTITSPTSGQVLSWSGTEWINSTLEAFDTQTATTTATTQTAIATYATASYDGVKAVITADDSVSGERSITEIVITHDGTTAVATEYAQVNTATALATYDVDISAGNIRILATPASTNSTSFIVKAITL